MMGETAKQEAIRALFPALLVLRYGVELQAALAPWAAAPLGWGGAIAGATGAGRAASPGAATQRCLCPSCV